MKSTLLSRRDLDFLLYEWLHVDELTKRDRFAEHSRETFDARARPVRAVGHAVLRAAQQEERRRGADASTARRSPSSARSRRRWTRSPQADLIGMSMDGEFGGAQLPVTVAEAGFAWFSAANVSTTGYLMLTIANANLLAKFGTAEQIDTFLRPMLAGRFSGTMALSETAGRVVARRHPHPRRTAGRRHLPAVRFQDVDLGRRTRAHRQHRQPRTGQDPRRTAGHQGHLAVHRAQIPCRRRRLGRRAQRRRAGRA